MIQDVIRYLTTHPGLLTGLAVVALLAVIGLWYVVAHHLKEIVIAMACFAGLASGVVVFYRGMTVPMKDLIAIGLFLIVLFPVIFFQSIGRSKAAQQAKPPATPGPVPARPA